MAVRIKDVASDLQMSVSTVSKALNGYPHVAVETRDRVSSAAQRLGYVPLGAARDLRRRRTDRIGFLYGFSSAEVGEYASRQINGAVAAAEAAGYNMLLYPFDRDPISKISRLCRSREVDGLLLMGTGRLAKSLAELHDCDMPFVVLARQFDDDTPFVSADHRAATTLATDHLVELGHRRIAYLGESDLGSINDARIDGYRRSLAAASIDDDHELIVDASDRPAAIEAARRLLTRAHPPTAVVAVHDQHAIACLDAAHENGRVVPDDLAVVGFDNLRSSETARPRLTTVECPLDAIGRAGAEALLGQLADAAPATTQSTFTSTLIARESTLGGAPA